MILRVNSGATLYLDNNATTRPDPAVIEAMLPFLTESYGNPSSRHRLGVASARAVAEARERVAGLLGCQPEEIVFTSGGTESNHMALASALQTFPDRKHLVTTAVEHSALLRPCEALAARGYEITRLPVDRLGRLNPGDLEAAIRPDTALVSVMMANNGTGVLFPVAEFARIACKKGVLFHTDAVQAAGKIPIDLGDAPVHFLSLSAHKFHGPKGIGALYVRRRTRFSPLFRGGGQEADRRAGTENVPGIVGLGKAAELALAADAKRVRAMRDAFERGALERIPGTTVNGDPDGRLPNTSNLSFEGMESEGLLVLLDRAGICCSAGSACTAGSLAASHVLLAMGCSNAQARSAVRFSFSRWNTPEEVPRLLEALERAAQRLRGVQGQRPDH